MGVNQSKVSLSATLKLPRTDCTVDQISLCYQGRSILPCLRQKKILAVFYFPPDRWQQTGKSRSLLNKAVPSDGLNISSLRKKDGKRLVEVSCYNFGTLVMEFTVPLSQVLASLVYPSGIQGEAQFRFSMRTDKYARGKVARQKFTQFFCNRRCWSGKRLKQKLGNYTPKVVERLRFVNNRDNVRVSSTESGQMREFEFWQRSEVRKGIHSEQRPSTAKTKMARPHLKMGNANKGTIKDNDNIPILATEGKVHPISKTESVSQKHCSGLARDNSGSGLTRYNVNASNNLASLEEIATGKPVLQPSVSAELGSACTKREKKSKSSPMAITITMKLKNNRDSSSQRCKKQTCDGLDSDFNLKYLAKDRQQCRNHAQTCRNNKNVDSIMCGKMLDVLCIAVVIGAVVGLCYGLWQEIEHMH